MNRLAVVLAADSASTVTYWSEKGNEDRYFKGTNKIFQLSTHHPVGLMIFDSADILKVPWEIVVKDFRRNLGSKSFASLDEYAKEFFSFLNSNTRLFPPSVQKDIFLQAARSASLRTLFRIQNVKEVEENKRRASADAALSTRRAEVDAMPLTGGIDPDAPSEAIATWRGDLIKMIEDWRAGIGVTYPSDLVAFAELGILEVFKRPGEFLGTTGLVFAGFGDHDVFPAMVAHNSHGIVAGRHVSVPSSQVAISHDLPAWLSAFAQTSMSDTFNLGLSEDIYASMMQALTDGLKDFASALAQSSAVDLAQIPDLDGLINLTRSAITNSILDKAREQHAYPLRRVLASLPVDEMADLAETLYM